MKNILKLFMFGVTIFALTTLFGLCVYSCGPDKFNSEKHNCVVVKK